MEFLEWLEIKYEYVGGQDNLLKTYTVFELHMLMRLYEREVSNV